MVDINIMAIFSIIVMIGALIYAYYKKIKMTYALIFTNFFIFILTVIFPDVIYDLGFRPIYLSLDYLPNLYTLFTSMFIHGGFAHIIGNMIVFFFVGSAFESRIGGKNFLIVYFISGIIGTLTHSIVNLGSSTILIGASGAIFGIMGAFAYLYPYDEIVMPIPLGIIMLIRRVKVIYAVAMFALFETVIVLIGVSDSTAHFAHLGGLIGGLLIAVLYVKNKAVMWNRYPSFVIR